MGSKKTIWKTVIFAIVFIAVCAIVAAVIFTIPSQKSPSNEAIEIGEQAIKIADQYLDGKASYTYAYNELSDLYDSLETYANDYESENRSSDLHIRILIGSLQTNLFCGEVGSMTDEEVREEMLTNRNELAKRIGAEKRKE